MQRMQPRHCVLFYAVFVGFSGLASNQNQESGPKAQEKSEHKITSESSQSTLQRPVGFCARCVPPTKCPEWMIMGYFGSFSHFFQNYERQTRTRNHTTLLHYQCTERACVLVSTSQLRDILAPTTRRWRALILHHNTTRLNNSTSTSTARMATVESLSARPYIRQDRTNMFLSFCHIVPATSQKPLRGGKPVMIKIACCCWAQQVKSAPALA